MLLEKPYKLAIIDDSQAMRTFLLNICAQNPSFEAHAFEDGEKALAYIEKERVRLVLVDVNMPTMFGDDLLRRCMALKLGIQVYVVTGADSLMIADRCMNVGARGVIPKPLLLEGCNQALSETERFFEQWNQSFHYFLKQKKSA
jgi:DNA-binding NtrC family response regulator